MTTIPEALNLALQHHQAGRLQEAEALYRQVLQAQPDHSDALHLLGVIAHQVGRHQAAVDLIGRAIGLNPAAAEYHNNMGEVYRALGRLDEAAAHFRQAIALRPSMPEAHNNAGNIFMEQGNLEEAIVCYQRALALNPNYAQAHNNLGSALCEQGDLEQALMHFREALRIDPGRVLWRLRMELLAPAVISDMDDVGKTRGRIEKALDDFPATDLGRHLDELSTNDAFPSFYLAYQGYNERPLRTKFARLFSTTTAAAKHTRSPGAPHVGFLVTAKHETAFLTFMRGVINNLSREFRITIICPASALARFRSEIERREVELLGMSRSIVEGIEQIRAARCDLLYHWEIGTDNTNYFLPFFGLAPVQCTSWGYPVTSGIPRVDYFISSALFEADDAKDHYSETLVQFDVLPTYYYRPQSPVSPKDRGAFGLPEKTHLYVCPQSLYKLHPDFDGVMGGILRADPDGLIVLLEGSRPKWTELLLKRLRAAVPDVVQRIRFVPRLASGEFMHLLAVADVMLDPLHWSGGSTSLQALALGLPVVTLPGEFMRGRVTYGCYRQMGLMDCVASTKDKYVDLAVRLGTDSARRERIKARILASNSVLFENTKAVSAFERFFHEAIAKG